jgi:hypothetical protein
MSGDPDRELELALKRNPGDKQAQVDVGSDGSMDASDPPAACQPGGNDPAPSNDFPETEPAIEVHEAFRRLAREQLELNFAFRELGTFLGAALTGRAMLDPEYVAASLDQLAADAGDKLAESSGEAGAPNPHLRFIADEVRKLCGETSRPAGGGD